MTSGSFRKKLQNPKGHLGGFNKHDRMPDDTIVTCSIRSADNYYATMADYPRGSVIGAKSVDELEEQLKWASSLKGDPCHIAITGCKFTEPFTAPVKKIIQDFILHYLATNFSVLSVKAENDFFDKTTQDKIDEYLKRNAKIIAYKPKIKLLFALLGFTAAMTLYPLGILGSVFFTCILAISFSFLFAKAAMRVFHLRENFIKSAIEKYDSPDVVLNEKEILSSQQGVAAQKGMFTPLYWQLATWQCPRAYYFGLYAEEKSLDNRMAIRRKVRSF